MTCKHFFKNIVLINKFCLEKKFVDYQFLQKSEATFIKNLVLYFQICSFLFKSLKRQEKNIQSFMQRENTVSTHIFFNFSLRP